MEGLFGARIGGLGDDDDDDDDDIDGEGMLGMPSGGLGGPSSNNNRTNSNNNNSNRPRQESGFGDLRRRNGSDSGEEHNLFLGERNEEDNSNNRGFGDPRTGFGAAQNNNNASRADNGFRV